MRKITVSAPSKLMLLGEHAVVYNRPCLVTAVDQRMRVSLSIFENPVLEINAQNVGIKNYQKKISNLGKGEIPKGTKFVELAVRNFKRQFPFNNGISIKTNSDFSAKFGFGSSSAATVCTVKGLAELFKVRLSNNKLFDICYQTVLDVQGKGSGFDVAVAIYGGTLYYVTGGKIIKPLDIGELPLIVGYTGFKASTTELMSLVSKKAEKHPKIIKGIYDQIQNIVEKAKQALLKKDWHSFGELMDINQGYLESLGVGSSTLSEMIYSARDAGAYGAKLSGAGVGDCMLALTPPDKKTRITNAINHTRGEVLKVKVNAEGARVESKQRI